MQSDENLSESEDIALAMLRAADPAADEPAVARQAEVRRRVMAEIDPGVAAAETNMFARRRYRWRLVAGLAVCLGAAAALLLGLNGAAVGPTSPAYAQGAIALAEQNPRLLPTEPGWTLSYAYVQPDRAITRFNRDGLEIDVWWNRTQYYPFADPSHPVLPSGSPLHLENVEVQGQPAAFVFDAARDDFRLIFPPDGDHYVYLIAGASGGAKLSRNEFLAEVQSMQTADVDTWLAALPPDLVQPVDQAAAVDSMLKGVPVPTNVDVEALRSEDLAMDRSQLGVFVTRTVACGWLSQWADARRLGDSQSARLAVEAIGSSRDWAALEQVDDAEGLPRTLSEVAEQMTSDPQALLKPEEAYVGAPGVDPPVHPAYFQRVGCDSISAG
jgi:hypothetical protein